MPTKKDDRVTKRRVTLTSYALVVDDDGKPTTQKHEVVDYVRPDFLDAYVEDAKTRWQHVAVADEPDAGPGGYEGATADLEHLRLGKTLQQHLHDQGIKHIDNPTNDPGVLFAEGN